MKYPIGIQTFADIRNEGFVYVDKTDLVYKLAHEGRYYFLSRPRRFGKSLLISTFDSYFSGRKELFSGLAIDKLETEWTTYPVLRLDLNSGDYSQEGELQRVLNNYVATWERQYGAETSETTVSLRFGGIIERACKQLGKKVAILVDEYDKPLLQTINNKEHQDRLRNEMKAFFSQIKNKDQYIRFAFFTGVTKMSKVSIFSDLNNLTDISLDHRYERICGISKQDLTDVFEESIKDMAAENNVDYDTMLEKLTEKYDGYHFSKGMTDMFNPFSLLNALSSRDLGSYWFESGTPTFLMELIRHNRIAIDKLDNMEMTAEELGKIDDMLENPKPLLYQSGYLTLKAYDSDDRLYTLGFPNNEVTEGFFKFLLPYYAKVESSSTSSTIVKLRKAIVAGDIDRFMLIMQSFFAGYDYSVIGKESLEVHYQNVIYAVCRLIGLRVKAEYRTSNGRIDLLIETTDSVYIFEFKLNLGTERALRQIEEKGYAAPFAVEGKRIYKIGVNFSSETRGIEDWQVSEE